MFQWTMHLKGPPELQHAIVAVGHKLYLFGQNGTERNKIDVKVFDTVSLRWMKSPPLTPGRGGHLEIPSRCHGFTAVLIGYIAYIWGGTPYCNVLYAFDVDAHTWFKPRVSGAVPEGRWGHSACVLGMGMYIYGGCIPASRNYFNDMYRLDTTTMVWYLINTRGTPPSRRCSQDHTATIIGTKIFVFGGLGPSDDNPHKTINVFDTETNSWLTTPIRYNKQLPKRRAHHAGFAYNGELYIFGGYNLYDLNSLKSPNDMWKFSPESFSWKRVEPKGKVLFMVHKLYSCMVGDRVFCTGDASKHELYVLDLSPSLKMLCKLAVIQYGLDQSELPHDIRWELAAFPTAEEYAQREQE